MPLATVIAYTVLVAALIGAIVFGVILSYHLLRFSPSHRVAYAGIAFYTLGEAILLFVMWGAVLNI